MPNDDFNPLDVKRMIELFMEARINQNSMESRSISPEDREILAKLIIDHNYRRKYFAENAVGNPHGATAAIGAIELTDQEVPVAKFFFNNLEPSDKAYKFFSNKVKHLIGIEYDETLEGMIQKAKDCYSILSAVKEITDIWAKPAGVIINSRYDQLLYAQRMVDRFVKENIENKISVNEAKATAFTSVQSYLAGRLYNTEIACEIEDLNLYSLGVDHYLLYDINKNDECSLINMPNEDEVIEKINSDDRPCSISNKK